MTGTKKERTRSEERRLEEHYNARKARKRQKSKERERERVREILKKGK